MINAGVQIASFNGKQSFNSETQQWEGVEVTVNYGQTEPHGQPRPSWGFAHRTRRQRLASGNRDDPGRSDRQIRTGPLDAGRRNH